jgi:hypothetical protein
MATNILTAAEASQVLRCASDDPEMLALLPLIDEYIKNATGHDWSKDNPILSSAKSAARILLVMWYENPGMLGSEPVAASAGLAATLTHLEVFALNYKQFVGRYGAGPCTLYGAQKGDRVDTVTGLINVTGDKASDFESVITVDNQIQQTSTDDLNENIYRCHITPPSEIEEEE